MESIDESRNGGLMRTVPGIVLVAYAVCCLAWWPQKQWRPEWDSAIYLLTGRSLAAGEGYTYLGRPFFLRPPGFSWLLSFTVRGGAYDIQSINRLVMLFAATAVGAVFFAVKRASTMWTAIAVAVLTGTCSLFANNFNWIVAEFPFLTLLFLAIGLLEPPASHRSVRWVGLLGSALALAAALYLRPAAVVLLPALVVAGSRRDGRRDARKAVVPALLVVLLVLPWWHHARQAAVGAERPSEQLLIFDYWTAMWHVDPGDPGSAAVPLRLWTERFEGNGSWLARKLASVSLHSEWPAATWTAALVLLAGWALRLRRRPSALEWFAPAYTLLLLGYFTYDSRLLLPLVPFVYLYLLTSLSFAADRVAARVRRPRLAPAARGVVFLLLFAANLPNVAHSGEWPSRGFPELANWIRRNTPEDAVILCDEAPVVAFLSGRRAYTYRFPRGGDLLSKYGADYVVLYPDRPPELHRLASQRAVGYWQVAGREVFRVRKP